MEKHDDETELSYDINLLKVSDLQSLVKHCRRIYNNLTLQMEQGGDGGFDILTTQQTHALIRTGF